MLYGHLRELFRVVKFAVQDRQPLELLRFLNTERIGPRLLELGERLHRIAPDPDRLSQAASARLRQNLHDIRGGALAGLGLQLEWLVQLNTEASHDDLLLLFYLARDHLKIMRNCFEDLDPERRALDRGTNFHSTNLIREKWENYQRNGCSVRYGPHAEAHIACCCLEFSTVDRVIYNVMNNAMRHGRGETVDFGLEIDDPDRPDNLRLQVTNAITEEQATRLNERFAGNFGRLFHGGFTTDGSGEGMRICAECVGNAYGYTSINETLQAGLIGAAANENSFCCWFYWPLLADVAATDD